MVSEVRRWWVVVPTCVDAVEMQLDTRGNDGPWVKYDEHEAEVTRLQGEVERLTAERDAIADTEAGDYWAMAEERDAERASAGELALRLTTARERIEALESALAAATDGMRSAEADLAIVIEQRNDAREHIEALESALAEKIRAHGADTP